MAQDGSRRFNWAGLPVIATVARLLCRELTLENEYLRLENRVLSSKVRGRIRFTDEERRRLVDAALLVREPNPAGDLRPDDLVLDASMLQLQHQFPVQHRRHRGNQREAGPTEASPHLFHALLPCGPET